MQSVVALDQRKEAEPVTEIHVSQQEVTFISLLGQIQAQLPPLLHLLPVSLRACFFFFPSVSRCLHSRGGGNHEMKRNMPSGALRQKNESMMLSKSGLRGHAGCCFPFTVSLKTTQAQCACKMEEHGLAIYAVTTTSIL